MFDSIALTLGNMFDHPVQVTVVDLLTLFFLLSLVVVRLTAAFKTLWAKSRNQAVFDVLCSNVLGIALAFAFGIDIFAAAGVVAVSGIGQIVAYIFTGVLMAFASNKEHELSEVIYNLFKRTPAL